ncbi:alcohol dehydrogenase catalytic domain-containing protein [Catenulispora subtropica]
MLPVRRGPRPTTTGREIPHDQLDQFSPPAIRDALLAAAERLDGVFLGPSQVSEPASIALRLRRPSGPWEAFLHPSRDEFGHVHRAGFLHLTVPDSWVAPLIEAGWAEPHPISRRPEWPDTIIMLYAPRDETELEIVAEVLRVSHRHATGASSDSTPSNTAAKETATMRAIAFADHGSAPEPHDLPIPTPAAGEVLVEVATSSVNGFDFGVLGGHLQGVYEYEFPVVLGKDFAGRVTALGAGVSDFAVGDRVFGVVMRPTLGQGGFAQYLAVPASIGVGLIPDTLDDDTAGALGLAATAALNAVDAVAPKPGETVLISGATGGVGTIAVQLAAARGATVIATARPGDESEHALRLGAAHAVDFAALQAGVRDVAPNGVDGALHLAGDGAAVSSLLVEGGRFASTMHFAPQRPDIVATAVMADPDRATLELLASEAAAGRLKLTVTSYPLAEFGKAFADFGGGTVGKLGVRI